MRKLFAFSAMALLALSLGVNSPAAQAQGQPSQKAFTDPPCGIVVGSDTLKPGDTIGQVFGIAGPPDAVEALRSKSGKVEDDYVDFVYFDQYEIRINKKNVIQSILIKNPSIQLKLNQATLRIGDPISKAVQFWGEPERESDNISMYYYRGVYIIHDQNGRIKQFFFSAPQSRENEEAGKQGRRPQGPAGKSGVF